MERKGITPIIAVTVLLAITVMAVGSLYSTLQSSQTQAKKATDTSELELSSDDLDLERCWIDSGNTMLRLRNVDRDTMNASNIDLRVNASQTKDYSISPSLVSPQETFTITIEEEIYREDPVILLAGDNTLNYKCLRLPSR